MANKYEKMFVTEDKPGYKYPAYLHPDAGTTKRLAYIDEETVPGADFGCDRIGRRCILQRIDDDIGAGPRQRQRNLPADIARGPGHEGGVSGECVFGHRRIPCKMPCFSR